MNDLSSGRVAAELQIAAWPPPVTQTLLRQGNGRLSLTVRGKPSGRLRVALEREGFAPLVVRTVHLRLRTPTILKVQIAWRGNEAVVAAAGQVIGSTTEFDPSGVVSPGEVEQSAPPVDHVDNASMRALRRRQAASLVPASMSAGTVAERCLARLAPTTLVLADLARLVQQGRRHHLGGMVAAIRRLVQGSDHEPALLQLCAGLMDQPLILYVPLAVPPDDEPATLLAAAFDVSDERGAGHELAIDLDAWLRHDARWSGNAGVPVGWLLRQADLALTVPIAGGDTMLREDSVRSVGVTEALCRLASCLCTLAARLGAGRSDTSGSSPAGRVDQAADGTGEASQTGRTVPVV